MNYKKIAGIIILALILLSAANATYAKDKEYNIIDALIDLTVHEDGLLHVNESYTYSFKGEFNGIYRDIPLKQGESVENLKVNIDGAYGNYEVSDDNGKKHIKVYLWADEAHTQKIHDQNVKITYSYDMKNIVTLYNDVGSLQYKLWGEGWDSDVNKITANIHLPGDKDIVYYLNPEYYNSSDSINGNTINIVTKNIPKDKFYELQVLMPLNDFKNAQYAKHADIPGKEQIMQKQADYKQSVNFWGSVFNILSTICIISPFSLILVYLKYGREPKVDYNGIYERELPTNDSPAVVNALLNRSSIGKPDMKGFEATIMDLIDRKVFKIIIEESEHTSDLILEFDESQYSELSIDEQKVFDLLNTFAYDNKLNVSELSSELNNEYNGKLFAEKFDEWKDIIEDECIGKDKLSEFFNNTGTRLSSAFTGCGLVFAALLFIIAIFSSHPAAKNAIFAAIFLGIISVIVGLIPEDIFGHWTNEGRVYYLKWMNFKKFLKDNSLIKEHPPESIVIWNKYLVYGTALGVADEVYESMKLYKPDVYEDDYYYSDLYRFHSYSGLIILNSAFNTGISASTPSSDIGDFGDIGGGSGGGGGGAF
jgi:uncharacterized membrane protein